MTNDEIQSIIKIGDICITSKDGVYRKFVGYDKCRWQAVIMNNRYDSCSTCKGRMIFGGLGEDGDLWSNTTIGSDAATYYKLDDNRSSIGHAAMYRSTGMAVPQPGLAVSRRFAPACGP